MKVNTRRLGPGDVETARGFVRNFHHRDISTDYLAKFLGNASNFLVVAEVDGAIIGYVLAYQIDRVDQDAASMFIYDIEVEDGHRRGGAGAALISHIRRMADERRMLETFVFTNRSNKEAVAFYESTGGRMENGDDLLFVYPGRVKRS